jgi:hypothetical protein
VRHDRAGEPEGAPAWVLITSAQSSSSIFHTTLSRSSPALLTRMSIEPVRSTTSCTAAATCSVCPTSEVNELAPMLAAA